MNEICQRNVVCAEFAGAWPETRKKCICICALHLRNSCIWM